MAESSDWLDLCRLAYVYHINPLELKKLTPAEINAMVQVVEEVAAANEKASKAR